MKLRSDKNKLAQVELAHQQLYLGKIDGLWGNQSQTAYNQYKHQKRIPKYLNLHDDSSDFVWNTATVSEWFVLAWDERMKQVRELPGKQHHPDILKYGDSVNLQVFTDEVPWCSAFVNWCIEQTERTTTKSALARSWLAWGHSIQDVRLGDVVIFKRGISKTYGHVGFAVYHEKEFNRIHVLGGNQSDAITIQAYPESDLLDCRWSL